MLASLFETLATGIGKGLEAVIDFVLNVLQLDLSAYLEAFPFLATVYTTLRGFSVGIAAIIAGFALATYAFAAIESGNQTQSVPSIAVRTVITGVVIYTGGHALEVLVKVAAVPYETFLNQVSADSGASFNVVFGVGAAVAEIISGDLLMLDLVVSLLELGVYLLLIKNIFSLILEVFERYLMVGVLVFTSPLAFSTIPSNNTIGIFKRWVGMFVGSLIQMTLSVVFLDLVVSGLASAGSAGSASGWALRILLTLAMCKIAQKTDNIMNQLGLGVAITGGGGILDGFGGVFGGLSSAFGGFGGGGGSAVSNGAGGAKGGSRNAVLGAAGFVARNSSLGRGAAAAGNALRNGKSPKEALGIGGKAARSDAQKKSMAHQAYAGAKSAMAANAAAASAANGAGAASGVGAAAAGASARQQAKENSEAAAAVGQGAVAKAKEEAGKAKSSNAAASAANATAGANGNAADAKAVAAGGANGESKGKEADGSASKPEGGNAEGINNMDTDGSAAAAAASAANADAEGKEDNKNENGSGAPVEAPDGSSAGAALGGADGVSAAGQGNGEAGNGEAADKQEGANANGDGAAVHTEAADGSSSEHAPGADGVVGGVETGNGVESAAGDKAGTEAAAVAQGTENASGEPSAAGTHGTETASGEPVATVAHGTEGAAGEHAAAVAQGAGSEAGGSGTVSSHGTETASGEPVAAVAHGAEGAAGEPATIVNNGSEPAAGGAVSNTPGAAAAGSSPAVVHSTESAGGEAVTSGAQAGRDVSAPAGSPASNNTTETTVRGDTVSAAAAVAVGGGGGGSAYAGRAADAAADAVGSVRNHSEPAPVADDSAPSSGGRATVVETPKVADVAPVANFGSGAVHVGTTPAGSGDAPSTGMHVPSGGSAPVDRGEAGSAGSVETASGETPVSGGAAPAQPTYVNPVAAAFAGMGTAIAYSTGHAGLASYMDDRLAARAGIETDPEIASEKYEYNLEASQISMERATHDLQELSKQTMQAVQNNSIEKLSTSEYVANFKQSGIGGGTGGAAFSDADANGDYELSPQARAAGLVKTTFGTNPDGTSIEGIVDKGDGRASAEYLAHAAQNYSSYTKTTENNTGTREYAMNTINNAPVSVQREALEHPNFVPGNNAATLQMLNNTYGQAFTDMKPGTGFTAVNTVDLPSINDGQGHLTQGGRVFNVEYINQAGKVTQGQIFTEKAVTSMNSKQMATMSEYRAPDGSFAKTTNAVSVSANPDTRVQNGDKPQARMRRAAKLTSFYRKVQKARQR